MRQRLVGRPRPPERLHERRRGPPAPAELVIALQRSAGNRAVQRMLEAGHALARTLDPALVARMQGGLDALRAPGDLQALVVAYNAVCPGDDTQVSLDARMGALDAVEHRVYAWFESVRATLDPRNEQVRTDPTLRAMFDLMNAIQREHSALVERFVATKARIWTHDVPSEGDRTLVDDLWSDLVEGRGAFLFAAQMTTTADNPSSVRPAALAAFKTEIMAALARLLSRPRGRSLLMALRAGRDAPDAPVAEHIKFQVAHLYKLVGMPLYGVDNPYVGATAIATNEFQTKPQATAGGLTAGPGSGSRVEVAPGVRDASLMDLGPASSFVPSPTFIGIGHELVHAAHYMRGAYMGRGAKGPPGMPPAYGGDVEEFVTIAAQAERSPLADRPLGDGAGPPLSALEALNAGLPNEADIRAEHGLGPRASHEGVANPFLHPASLAGQLNDPGKYVDDVLGWLENTWPVEGAAPEAKQLAELRRAQAPAAPAVAAAAAGAAAAAAPAAAPRTQGWLEWLRSWFG